ncbi:hypothetical protein SAMN05877753_105372 [Bacillus oleivorans]|uniref:Uncharacterized protein n=1 Tax=Bacillus oleivorans TaxID=1448271 RepID=A0A285CW51_9BACI|nr:hypothetical protein [Bacillus oleivorans]SNX71777.1 hypothetical protein SAMN05877753_105372 [Bacillus oleivorans]
MNTIERLAEAIEILDSTLLDERELFEVKVTDHTGTNTLIENREQHYYSMMQIVIEMLELLKEELEEREQRKKSMKLLK